MMNPWKIPAARTSQFELIRIVAMSFILLHHFLYHAWPKDQISTELFLILDTCVLSGVNLFFLISGWFLIRTTRRKLLSFFLLVLFYCAINYAGCLIFGLPFTIDDLLNIILWPVSRSTYWFLHIYMFLMLAAPVINIGLQKINIHQFRSAMLLMTVFTLYSNWLGGNGTDNTGFTFFHGFYMYILGHYLHRDTALYAHLTPRRCIAGFIILLAVSCQLLFVDFKIFEFSVYHYGSVTQIGSAVFLFAAISKMQFRSKAVNLLGSISLGCYLLQDGLFGQNIFYPRLQFWLRRIENIPLDLLLLLALFLVFWALALLIHPLLKTLSTAPSSLLPQTKTLSTSVN